MTAHGEEREEFRRTPGQNRAGPLRIVGERPTALGESLGADDTVQPIVGVLKAQYHLLAATLVILAVLLVLFGLPIPAYAAKPTPPTTPSVLPIAPGTPVWPVRNPDIVSPFGMRMHPILGYSRLHAGVDLNGVTGDPVFAATDGVVSQRSDSSGYGNHILLASSDPTISTLYGHLSSFSTSDGATVKAGDLIGLIGTTGLSTGPHLHFELHVDGEPHDPVVWLQNGVLSTADGAPVPSTTLIAPPPPPPLPEVDTSTVSSAHTSLEAAHAQVRAAKSAVSSALLYRRSAAEQVRVSTVRESKANALAVGARQKLGILARTSYMQAGGGMVSESELALLASGPSAYNAAQSAERGLDLLGASDAETLRERLTAAATATRERILSLERFTAADMAWSTSLTTLTENKSTVVGARQALNEAQTALNAHLDMLLADYPHESEKIEALRDEFVRKLSSK